MNSPKNKKTAGFGTILFFIKLAVLGSSFKCVVSCQLVYECWRREGYEEHRSLFLADTSEKLANNEHLADLRIPDDADQRSGMMPITIPF